MSENKELLFEMKNIEKIFSHVHALDHVNFDVRKGEVHALLGENGAGKSTLIKILTGVYTKDGGQIYLEIGIGQSRQVTKIFEIAASIKTINIISIHTY